MTKVQRLDIWLPAVRGYREIHHAGYHLDRYFRSPAAKLLPRTSVVQWHSFRYSGIVRGAAEPIARDLDRRIQLELSR